MEKIGPIEKIYEAWSAIADGRIEMHEDENYAWVDSSDRSKYYEVSWEDNVYGSSDSATYWQGYAGYPVLAVWMKRGKLSCLKEELLEELKGIAWKELNDKYKRDYTKAAEEALKNAAHKAEITDAAEKTYEEIKALDISVRRGRIRHKKENAQ